MPIDPEYVSSDVVLSITTEATGTIYFMAGEEDEADIIEILESLEEGTITIEKGDLTVSNLAAGITVENNGTGKVEINGQEVPEGESITVPDPDNQEPATDNPELDEEGKIKTGVKGNIAVCALGMLALIGAVTTRRFLK